MAYWSIDPWGEQRADMRMARIATACLQPHMKAGSNLDPADFMLYPDAAHQFPDNVEDQERQWMMKIDRLTG